MKKLIALIITVAVLAAVMVACGSDDSDSKSSGVILPTDAQGETVYPVDDNGYPVYPTDAAGQPVYATDADGNDLIATDTDGTPITGNGGKKADPTAAPSGTDAPAGTSIEDPTEEEIPVIIVPLPEDSSDEFEIDLDD